MPTYDVTVDGQSLDIDAETPRAHHYRGYTPADGVRLGPAGLAG
jgi:hypothetical protein